MSTTTISDDILFRGEIQYEGHLAVHGRVEGRLLSNDVLEVSQGGHVNADIYIDQVQIKGDITGNIKATSVHIYNSGKLYGDIDCAQLQIDRGGKHNGVTIMDNDENRG